MGSTATPLDFTEFLEKYSVFVAKADFKFNAAHFVAYKGFRERLHGHNYTVGVRLEAEGAAALEAGEWERGFLFLDEARLPELAKARLFLGVDTERRIVRRTLCNLGRQTDIHTRSLL